MRLLGKATGVLAAVLLVSACGGGSSNPTTLTKAQWESRYGAAVRAVSTQLDFARTDLDKGVQQDILDGCSLLRDDVTTAKGALPVPNAGANAALSKALTELTQGAADCIHGAQVASQASINEAAMRELTTSRTELDMANQAIAAWS
ncbi:MAG: hypothetical protein ACRDZ8_06500 [Acidimicrobiales bacterium]